MSKKKKLNLKLFENTATLIKVVHLEKKGNKARGVLFTLNFCVCVYFLQEVE